MFFETSEKSAIFRGKRIRFALTDRFGGVSKTPFDSLNLGFHTGDEKEAVRANRARVIEGFRAHFGLESNPTLYYLRQIHSCAVIRLMPKISEGDFVLDSRAGVDSINANADSRILEADLGEGDAMITNAPNALCMVMVADCNPILIYDSANEAFALIHAGRAGVFSAIVERAIEKMARNYGTKTEECLVYVGSSIRGCCYEVGAEIAQEARDLGYENAVIESGISSEFKDIGGEKIKSKSEIKEKSAGNKKREITYKLDLIACLKAQFARAGIRESNIEICPQCSKCNENFYSYRRDKRTGRYALLAMLV